MASDMQSALAAALEVVLQGIGISTLDGLASAIVDHGDDIAAYITSSGCRHAGLVAAQERERAAQAAAAANSAAAAALQAATTSCSRAELEARLLRDEAEAEVSGGPVNEAETEKAVDYGDVTVLFPFSKQMATLAKYEGQFTKTTLMERYAQEVEASYYYKLATKKDEITNTTGQRVFCGIPKAEFCRTTSDEIKYGVLPDDALTPYEVSVADMAEVGVWGWQELIS